jgi:hypothetical protein
MDRAVRFSLFALATCVGVLFVTFASNSTDETEEGIVLAEGGRDVGVLNEKIGQQRVELAWQTNVEASRQAQLEAPEPPFESEEDLEMRVRERGRQRAATITEAVDREPVDPDWGPATQTEITERFMIKAPLGFELQSVACKTSLCMAEIETPSRKAGIQEVGWHRFLGLSRAYIHHGDEGGDTHRVTVFLARDGHPLPK